ncbi:WG repeat-containing protein [Chitinophaga pinensis]|nr:WG repeat-containing protein [Chitinophaga pinensis]
MRIVYALLLLLIISGHQSSAQDRRLFLIQEGGKYGFINREGKMIIPPKFHVARNFSEGLAAVREGEYYGYIDTTGTFIIPARFAYAKGFNKGIAQVYIDGRPFYIDRNGNKLFDDYYDYLAPVGNNRALVTTMISMHGLIDMQGKILTDLRYRSISDFNNGYAVAERHDEQYPFLIDTLGQRVTLPYHYRWIQDIGNGYYLLTGPDSIRLIGPDLRTRFVKEKTALGNPYFGGKLQEGLLVAQLTKQGLSPKDKINYQGYLDTCGHLLIAIPGQKTVIDKNFNGFRLILANTSRDTVEFPVYEGSLEMELQALTPQHEWMTIEKNTLFDLMLSCGNSFWNVPLTPQQYWRFDSPVYEGVFKTKLRFVIADVLVNHKGKTCRDTIYSNEFEGSINPAQIVNPYASQKDLLMPAHLMKELVYPKN